MKWDIRILPFTIFFLLFSSEFFPQGGTLDPTFGNGGIVTTPIGDDNVAANSVAIQSDSKIVAAGDSVIVRYNIDGSLDTTFGTSGIVTTEISIKSIVIQSDDRTIAAGSAVARYNIDGRLDTTFGTNGIASTEISIRSVVIQNDDKIIATGSFYNGSDGDFGIVRYNIDGSLDTTFGTNGIVTTQSEVSSSEEVINSAAIQSDGKIVVGGNSYLSDLKVMLARYNMDGSPDTTFGDGGIVITSSPPPVHLDCNSVAIQTSGKIIAAGYQVYRSDPGILYMRYNSDGSLDFMNDFQESFGAVWTITSMAVQSNDKIVAAAWDSNAGMEMPFVIIRFNNDLSIDTTFGSGGSISTYVEAWNHPYSVALQKDGKIIVAGECFSHYDNGKFAIVRYLNGGDVIPVELTSFNYSIIENNVILNWTTATETNNYGFDVERAISDNNKNMDWSTKGFIPSHTTSVERNQYSFIDYKLNPGSYTYRLKMIDQDGSFEYSRVINANISNPVHYSLSQNYPNPFNPSTVIKYQIPETKFVSLKVYDVLGNEVATLVNEIKSAGFYNVEFDASLLSNGVYFYRLQTGKFVETKKMILMK